MKKFNRPASGYKSYHSAFNGIMNFVMNNYSHLIPNVQANKQFNILNELLIQFLKQKELAFRNSNSEANKLFNSNMVQDNFKLFKHWLKNYKT